MDCKCTNTKCAHFDKVDHEYSITISYSKNGEKFCAQQVCPYCGQMREDVTEVIPPAKKNIQMGRYTSMSKDQKTDVLKKRSHEHYNKELKEQSEFKMQSAMKEMREKL